MGCLSWPQKKALKIAFKIIERQLGDDSSPNNSQGNQINNMNNGNNMHMNQMPLQQNQQSNKAHNIKLAMNLVGKVLDL